MVCSYFFYFREFFSIFPCFWTNLYLIKFVTMHFCVWFMLVWLFCRCVIDLHAVKNLWLISHHLQYQRGPANHRRTLITRDSRLFWTLNPSTTISRMPLRWWKGLWGLTHWDQLLSLKSLLTKIGLACLVALKILLKSWSKNSTPTHGSLELNWNVGFVEKTLSSLLTI